MTTPSSQTKKIITVYANLAISHPFKKNYKLPDLKIVEGRFLPNTYFSRHIPQTLIFLENCKKKKKTSGHPQQVNIFSL